jgi:hypothetical protein
MSALRLISRVRDVYVALELADIKWHAGPAAQSRMTLSGSRYDQSGATEEAVPRLACGALPSASANPESPLGLSGPISPKGLPHELLQMSMNFWHSGTVVAQEQTVGPHYGQTSRPQ